MFRVSGLLDKIKIAVTPELKIDLKFNRGQFFSGANNKKWTTWVIPTQPLELKKSIAENNQLFWIIKRHFVVNLHNKTSEKRRVCSFYW